MTELKPCPCCEGKAKYFVDTMVYGTPDHMIYCTNCGLRVTGYNSEEEAIEAWNRRPSPWRKGTPTEEGDYLVKVRVNGNKDTDFYQIMRLNDFISYLKGQDKFYAGAFYEVVAWQKIEPYKEKEDGIKAGKLD